MSLTSGPDFFAGWTAALCVVAVVRRPPGFDTVAFHLAILAAVLFAR